MPRSCICICICICICNRVERKLVLVKWRQRFARTVGKGSRGLHKAGNEKIPRYQWEVDIEISRGDQMSMRGHQDTSENISTRSYQDIDEKKLGYQWRYRWDDIKVSRYWVAKRELCFDTVRNHQAGMPALFGTNPWRRAVNNRSLFNRKTEATKYFETEECWNISLIRDLIPSCFWAGNWVGRVLHNSTMLQFPSDRRPDKFKPFPPLSLKPNICSSVTQSNLFSHLLISYKTHFIICCWFLNPKQW